jgi:hypothetical protein
VAARARRAPETAAADARATVPARRIPRPVGITAAALAGLLAAVLLVSPWLAVRWTKRGVAVWRTDAAAGYRDLERAADANPVSITPLLYAGVIAVQRGELDRAKGYLERGLEREDDWLAHYELAAIAADRGDRQAAMRQLELAARGNVRDPAIRDAQENLAKRKNMSAQALNGRLSEFPLFKDRRLS